MVEQVRLRYRYEDLLSFTTDLFSAAGCDGDKPKIIATALIEADLLGHTTHGLQLAAPYLREIERGTLLSTGEPEILVDRLATVTWNGRYLPGVWLTTKAVELAINRVSQTGIVAVAIQQSHHIGCLAAFLQQATDRQLLMLLTCSDPSVCSVAPYGGRRAVFTPDPLAIGIPTDGDPIMIDMSASITTNGLTNRLRAEGKPFPGNWALDADGNASNDPNVLYTNPPGTLLPTGGMDHGHKGYGLALLIESLTNGLGGLGRMQKPTVWGASVYLQVIDPEAFGGRKAFIDEMTFIAHECRTNPPIPNVSAVRLPGQHGLAHKRQSLATGLPLYPGIIEALTPLAERWGIAVPNPVAG